MTQESSGQAARARRTRAPNTHPTARGIVQPAQNLKTSELVYRHLRQEIVGMELRPGDPVPENDIAYRHGVSRTPVREAILRLAEERLVEVVPKSGTFVSRIPISSLRDALAARKALEAVTVRAAAQRASASQVMELRAIVQRQRELAEQGDESAYHKADEDFHAAVARVGKYPGIWDIVLQVKVNIDRYRLMTLPLPGRMQMATQEHEAVVEAIAAGDANAAVAGMDAHLGKLTLDIAVFRDTCPDYFIYDIDIEEDFLDAAGS